MNVFTKGIVAIVGISLATGSMAAEPISFQEDIHPILAERCFKCHGGENRKGGFSMNSRDDVLAGGEFGPAIVLGNGSESLMIELLQSDDEDEWMPPKGERLSPEQIELIRQWIDADLDWDMEIVPDTTWKAPLQLVSVDLPRRKGMLRSKHPVDRLISRDLSANDVEAPEVVDDRRYIRRVYMDLLGLLPTPEAVEAYANDGRADKLERLIDSLLADDRSYAEHWMTFWNDALRNDYKGTGYIDGGRKQISGWLYRALYKNEPYDEFVRELIAPSAAAEGFIKGIKWRGAQTANQVVSLQAARNVSQVFLGVNMKCASCHDSFVNQWTLADAYGLANAFSEEPMELFRCDVSTGEMASTRFLWPELGGIDATATVEERQKQTAALVTSDENGWFARTIVNRLWKSLMGRGLVEPLDSMDEEPWNAELLDMLAATLTEQDYDLKAMLKTITTSTAYQLESDVREPAGKGYYFTGPVPRRLRVEQFYDAMGCVTGVWQEKSEFDPKAKPGSLSDETTRAWRVAADPMMRALGRPNREQVTLARETDYTRLQALELTNGGTLATYLSKGAQQLLSKGSVETANLFTHALGRPMSSDELVLMDTFGATLSSPEDVEDVLWLLFNHPEFQLVF